MAAIVDDYVARNAAKLLLPNDDAETKALILSAALRDAIEKAIAEGRTGKH